MGGLRLYNAQPVSVRKIEGIWIKGGDKIVPIGSKRELEEYTMRGGNERVGVSGSHGISDEVLDIGLGKSGGRGYCCEPNRKRKTKPQKEKRNGREGWT